MNSRKILLLALVIVLIVGGTITILKLKSNKTTASVISAAVTPKIQIQPAKSVTTINKEFSFPIKDATGKEVGKIKYLMDGAEKRDEIIVKGQKATAIAGRTFLIINLKITNESTQKIQMNTRDYIRLSVNNSPEWLAPDIHNDPVEIQAISTKYTRTGFPISDTDSKLKLQVGEIGGDKTAIDINF